MKQLNLGCGGIGEPVSQGWINYDIRGRDQGTVADVIGDIRQLPFKDNSLDHIFAFNCLDHLRRCEVLPALKEWCRTLKSIGSVRIIVPDFNFVARTYLSGEQTIEEIQGIYGSQDYEYNFHYIAFDEKYLTDFLRKAGFTGKILNEGCGHRGGLQLIGYK